MSFGSLIERSGQSAEWYINRGVGALLREARGSQVLDPVLASCRIRVRLRGARSDDADRSLHEARPQHPLLEAVFFGTAVSLCRATGVLSAYSNERSTPRVSLGTVNFDLPAMMEFRLLLATLNRCF